MKTPTFKLYAAPVALLLMAGVLATPTASAETAPHGYRMVQSAFHFNPEAPADQIYAKLRRLAERMCANPGPRPLSFRKIDKECVASAMEDGISRIGRTDIAAIHGRDAG
jgi:UrcA family protein